MKTYDITIRIRVEAKSEKGIARLVDRLEKEAERGNLVEQESGSYFTAEWEEVA